AAGVQAELRQDRPEELPPRHGGVQDERGPVGRAELLEDRPADGRLAGADLAGDLDEALALLDAEQDVVERLPVPLGEEEETRVGRAGEWRFLGPLEVVVQRDKTLSHRSR